ncbi:MAG: hypothetical protein ABIJ46_00785, partial [bacterium]
GWFATADGCRTTTTVSGLQLALPVSDDSGDSEEFRQKQEKELADARKYAETLKRKLDNADFVARAPEQVVAGEKQKLAETEARISKLEDQLKSLG